MPKRRLQPSECRLVLWAMELSATGSLQPSAQLHLARQRVGGGLVMACEVGQLIYDGGAAYYTFPFLEFIWKNAPICPTCKKMIYTERLVSEVLPVGDGETP